MTYSAAAIANAFLNLAFANQATITPMKIQKLVYLAHGYSLVIRDAPLIDELFEAWRFGPVLPSLYQSCKKYGKNPISRSIEDIAYGSLSNLSSRQVKDVPVLEILAFVWENYGSMDAIELSDWTHEKDGPWDSVLHKSGLVFKNQTIDNELIKKYFKERMCADDNEKAQ